MIAVWVFFSYVSAMVNNMQWKPLINSVLDETITKAMIVKMQGIKYVSKNICLCILKLKVIHSGFLWNVAITLLDKTYSKYPKRRENCWMKTVKTYAPFGLNIEDIVWTIWFRSINVTGGLTSLVLFGILVWPGTHLGQDFPDITCDFCIYCIVDFLIIDLLFLCNLFLRYVLPFYYVLVLFQFPGANYFAHH